MDYFLARYYSSTQGRFISPDPLNFWMLDRKKQDIYLANPQRWNRYVYVLNDPLRYVDPDGLAEVPAWNHLDKNVRDDLAKRLGKDAQKSWNEWSNDQRQQVLNLRADLIVAKVWDSVTGITYGTWKVTDHTWPYRNETTFTRNNSREGWQLAFTATTNIEHALKAAGYDEESANWNHAEGRVTLKQEGDDVVLHVVMFNRPSDDYAGAHWDGGGGSILSGQHRREMREGRSATPDEVTRSRAGTPAAQYLRGISPSIDKLLTQK